MKDGSEIIEMTPLIFEDGDTYYFKIVKRDTTIMLMPLLRLDLSNDYHNLFVYKKVLVDEKYGFLKLNTRKVDFMQVINEDPELVSTKMDINDIKSSIKKVIISNKAASASTIRGWDGFVGNVSDESKKALLRDSKLKDILG